MLDLILAREVYSFNTLLILMVTTEYNLILGGIPPRSVEIKFLSFGALIQPFNYLFAPCRGNPDSAFQEIACGIWDPGKFCL